MATSFPAKCGFAGCDYHAICLHSHSIPTHALVINALLSHTLAGISHLNLVGGVFTDHCVVGLEGRSNGVRQMGSIL